MPLQTVPREALRLPTGSPGSRAPVPRADPVLEEAVARIGELTRRLRSVGSVHAPRRTRFGGRPRCIACGSTSPCPTLLAIGATA